MLRAGCAPAGGGRRDGPRPERQSRRLKSNGGQGFQPLTTTVGVEGRCRPNPGPASPRRGRRSPVSLDRHRGHRHLRGRSTPP